MEKISYPIDETLSDVKNKKCPILYAMKILPAMNEIYLWGAKQLKIEEKK